MLLNLYTATHRLQATVRTKSSSATLPQAPSAVTLNYPAIVFLRARSRVTNLPYTIPDTTDKYLVHFTAPPSPGGPPSPPDLACALLYMGT